VENGRNADRFELGQDFIIHLDHHIALKQELNYT